MDLVTQYLRAVAALLPKDQREDITAELRDIILSRIEAREETLGRPLTGDEIEEELRVVGHPILVAARYRDDPQALVGPALYPYWMFGVKIAVAIQAFAGLISLIVRTLRGQDFGYALGHAIGQAVVGSLTLIGVATVAAWLIERQKIHVAYLDKWRVRDLRVLEYAGWDLNDLCDHFLQRPASRPAARARDAASYLRAEHSKYGRSPVGQAIFLVAFGTVFVLWWAGVIHLGLIDHTGDLLKLGLDPGPLGAVKLGELHDMLFWPVLAYGVAVIVQGGLILAYPRSVWLWGLVNILMGVAVLVICGWLWNASPISAAIQVSSVAELVLNIKHAFQNSPPLALAPMVTLWLAIAAFTGLCKIVRGLWEMLVLSRRA